MSDAALDVDSLRAATPGCARVAHLNNAGAALPTQRTLDTVVAHLRLEADMGGYEAAASTGAQLEAVRHHAERLLGAPDGSIALTTSDTAAWTKAFWGFVLGGGLERSRRIVVDHAVYNSHHLAVLQAVRHLGATVEVVPAGADGTLDLDAMAAALRAPAAMVSATHVPTSSGLVNPVADVGRLAAAAEVPYFLDACQSVGQLPVDVGAIGCQVATVTGRKWLRGPRGTGLLFVEPDFSERLDPPGIDASSAEWTPEDDYQLATGTERAEEFERPIAALMGLGAAIEQLLELGVDAVSARIGALAGELRTRLDERDGITTLDGRGPRSGIVTFSVQGADADELAVAAADAGINVSVSRAGQARHDLGARGLDTVVRASPHVYNTVDELDRLLDVVQAVGARR
jgi:selenocysteine lyase/cysteine desulfurase